MTQKVLETNGTWLFVAPVRGVTLVEATNYEHRIDRVTLVSSAKLPLRRKRLGFPVPISKLKRKHEFFMNRFFHGADTFILFRITGEGLDLEDKFLTIAREELAILALSQLGYTRRNTTFGPTLVDENPIGHTSYLLLNTDTGSWVQSNKATKIRNPLVLNETWMRFQREAFYVDLIRWLRGEVRVDAAWRKNIRNAAILAGQSQISNDIPQSFLWNMIALELLLTKQDDKLEQVLPKRAEAFLGWTVNWANEDYESKIHSIYDKRNKLVHSGNRESIKRDDIDFTDHLLLNVFVNIVKHPDLLYSKEALVKFSDRVQAEHTLGINAKVRPKTLTFVS